MLEKAKKILEEGNHTCVLIREDTVLTSDMHGVKQLLDWNLEDGYIADKIIGKAAASIMICGKVREVYAKVISNEAINLFTKYNTKFTYSTAVEHIKNRDGTDICPMEKLCLPFETAQECIEAIEQKIAMK